MEGTQPHKAVLLVDDNYVMREMMSLVLGGDGYRVATAANGADALRRLVGHDRPDLILLDLNMPVMDGFGFLERLAERGDPRPPIIVITTESGAADRERAKSLGAVAYVTKPVRGHELAQTVQQVLGNA